MMHSSSVSSCSSLSVGFADPVHDAQRAFRRALEALSHPGQSFSLGLPVPGLALGPAMAHLLLALTDHDTPVWWQLPDAPAADWLRFHTGAPLAKDCASAVFAVLGTAADWPALDAFAQGALASPETSATLLVEVPALDSGPAQEWSGPGMREKQIVRIAGLTDSFWAQRQASQASFPLGVDIVFTCADAALGLPRTTRVRDVREI